jgi:hypothetical protein
MLTTTWPVLVCSATASTSAVMSAAAIDVEAVNR